MKRRLITSASTSRYTKRSTNLTRWQAAAFEKRLRLESFLDLPSQCGKFELRVPTICDMLELEYAENRFLEEEVPQLDDYIHLLWQLRTGNETRDESDFAKFVALKLSEDEKLEIAAFFGAQFNDMPSQGGGGAEMEFESSVSMVSLIDLLCHEYGWGYREAMQTPVPVALQLTQRIVKRHNPKYAIRNGITQRAKAREMSNG